MPFDEGDPRRPFRGQRSPQRLPRTGHPADADDHRLGRPGSRRRLQVPAQGRGRHAVALQPRVQRRADSAADCRGRPPDGERRGQRRPQLHGRRLRRDGTAPAVLPALRRRSAETRRHRRAVRPAGPGGSAAQGTGQGIHGRIFPHPPRTAPLHHREQSFAGRRLRPVSAAARRHLPFQRRQRRSLLPHRGRSHRRTLPRISLPAAPAGRNRPHGRPHQPDLQGLGNGLSRPGTA